jgi:hypothetical protein
MLKTIGLILGLALLPAFGHKAPPPATFSNAAPPLYVTRDTLSALATGLR